jgi:serine/threonine protein phosphatase PrpC
MDDARAYSSNFEPQVFGAAIQGQRSEQQDSIGSTWLTGESSWLTIIADGMGGHAAGGVASRIAVEAFGSTFVAARLAGAALGDALAAALNEANSRIAGAQKQAPALSGMGTTLVAAHISPQGIAWISVGDSPLWLFRGGALTRLNEDHSLRAMVPNGLKVSGNVLQSALTGESIEMIDCRADPLPLRPEDAVVIASDGLLTLSEQEISSTLRKANASGPEAATRWLLEAVEARQKAGQDNCSVIVAFPRWSRADRRAGRFLLVAATIAAVAAALAVLAFELDTGLISLSAK